MILIDLNQVMISNMMAQLGGKGSDISEDLVRHMILNSIRGYNVKFKEEFGDIIICCDSRHYWRREVFPNYKSQRKQAREESSHDWDKIFTIFNQVRDELKEQMPYRVVDVYGAEADDIIAVLCGELEYENGKTLILSGDKDFIQLQKYRNVSQYSPVTKKYVNGVDPEEYLNEHIVKGDSSDGVPNVLSPDNTFVDGLRQKPLSKKKIVSIVDGNLPNDEVKRNYQRNETLIDLTKSPAELFFKILDEWHNAPEGDRSKLLNYFTQKRLRNLVESIGEF